MKKRSWLSKQFYWQNIFQFIVIPILCVISIVLLYDIGKKTFNQYLENEYNKSMYEYQIKAEEKRKQDELIKESQRKEKERLEKELQLKKESEIAAQQQRVNAEYETKVSQKHCPKGTYLYNKDLNKVGRVIGYYGLQVNTDGGWFFSLNEVDGSYPSNILEIGWKDFNKRLAKEITNKKLTNEEVYQLKQRYEDSIKEETRKTQEKYMWFERSKLVYIKYKNICYKVIDIKGRELKCVRGPKNKSQKYTFDGYDKDIEQITYREYDKSLVGGK